MTLIIIQQGDPNIFLTIPSWVNYELYTKLDMEKTLGADAWIIDASSDSTSSKSFGCMVAKREFVFFLDIGTIPTVDEKTGALINPLQNHMKNLLTASHPYYFNTQYDAFRPGTDFGRGYPHTLREGIPTAVSMGPVLRYSNYDPSTRLAKLDEFEERRPDVVSNVPYGILYSMSSVNLAINRKIMGPLMFIGGLMKNFDYDIGDGYLEILTGWLSKVVLDHVRAGVKIGGDGYVVQERFEDPFDGLRREIVWRDHMEEVVRFFSQVELSGGGWAG